jgi:glycosyltransferase involved in cell wall biosynthesis
LQAIAAFEKLWEQGVNATLVIVGKEGWGPLPDNQRRTIPKIVNKLRNHPELNKRLFWLEGISDEYLEKIYAASTCLIAASEGEGFGLPLIEAAQYKLPIIARDLPVFREVAGDHAFYFEGLAPESLAQAIRTWSALNDQAQTPGSDKMPWLTWEQSALELIKVILP